MAVSAAQVVSDPGVYSQNPTAALSVMSNSNTVANTDSVAAASPTVRARVTTILRVAQSNTALTNSDPTTVADIGAILGTANGGGDGETTGNTPIIPDGTGRITVEGYAQDTPDVDIVEPNPAQQGSPT